MGMVTTIVIVLFFLWMLGVLVIPSVGWVIHVLLVVAVIMVLVRVISGENPFK